MDCSPPGSSVRGILQARIWEWVTSPSSRGISPTQGLNLHLLYLLHRQAEIATSAAWKALSSFINNQKTVPRDSCKCRTLKLQTQIPRLTCRHNHLFPVSKFFFPQIKSVHLQCKDVMKSNSWLRYNEGCRLHSWRLYLKGQQVLWIF